MELEFKHMEPLTTNQYIEARLLIHTLNKYEKISGKQIAKEMGITPIKVRKIIQNIREHNNEYLPLRFIIATTKGYQITSDKHKIKKWAKARRTKAVSGLAQVDQAWKIAMEDW